MTDCMINTAYRTKSIKKKTRNRQILLQNLNKGKARKQNRCGFQLIPCPMKFAGVSEIHYLYGDVILLERQDTFVMEATLYNNSKIYKSVQVVAGPNQKLLKIKVENKNTNVQLADWRQLVQKLENSESAKIRQWTDPVKTYCERYETVIKELQAEQQGMSNERYNKLIELNDKVEKTRESITKTYPCIEFKSQLKDGQVQLTEVNASEKYLTEIGYTLDEFAATVLKEGLPEVTPLSSVGATMIAKLRLQKYLTTDQDGFQTPEFESCVLMKNGCMKKIKMRIHYHMCYEKGVAGFVFIAAIVAKQKPFIRDVNYTEAVSLDKDFVELMAKKERDMNEFLSMYYNEMVEQKFTNINRVCRIKEIKPVEEEIL